jgi:cytochrome c553
MTKTQIWLASFLVLFLLLFLLEQITNKEGNNNSQVYNPVPQTNLSSKEMTPEELINKLGCVSCHGADLNGTKMGPDLHNLSQYWSRESLVNFLRNPSANLNSSRLNEYKSKYPDVLMPSFENIDVKDLGKIAGYLLKQRK